MPLAGHEICRLTGAQTFLLPAGGEGVSGEVDWQWGTRGGKKGITQKHSGPETPQTCDLHPEKYLNFRVYNMLLYIS
jgi:hypothetical protein